MTILSALIESAVLGLAKNAFLISGTKGPGYVLAVIPQPGYAVTGATTFQWTRNGVDIIGQTSSSYTQQATDRGAEVGCRVSGLARVASIGVVPSDAPSAPTGNSRVVNGFAVNSSI